MEEIKRTIKEVYRKSIYLSLLPISIGIILADIFFILGIILGLTCAMFNFYLLSRKIVFLSLTAEKFKPIYIFSNYIFRYLIMAIILVLAIKINLSAFVGASLGLFIIPLAIYFGKWKI